MDALTRAPVCDVRSNKVRFTTLCILLIICSGCSSIIGFNNLPPTESLALLKVNQTDGLPEVTVYEISTKYGSETHSFYKPRSVSPSYFNLREGSYILEVGCNVHVTDDEGKAGPWLFLDRAPTIEVIVKANTSYILGCRPTETSLGLYFEKINS